MRPVGSSVTGSRVARLWPGSPGERTRSRRMPRYGADVGGFEHVEICAIQGSRHTLAATTLGRRRPSALRSRNQSSSVMRFVTRMTNT
jgi:hypothetical protein